jgi:hypothetical protein
VASKLGRNDPETYRIYAKRVEMSPFSGRPRLRIVHDQMRNATKARAVRASKANPAI